MAKDMREALEMVRDDAAADADKIVEFTPLGLGTARGEELAMTHALAENMLKLLDRIEAVEHRAANLAIAMTEHDALEGI